MYSLDTNPLFICVAKPNFFFILCLWGLYQSFMVCTIVFLVQGILAISSSYILPVVFKSSSYLPSAEYIRILIHLEFTGIYSTESGI